jgi:hypothetical protein
VAQIRQWLRTGASLEALDEHPAVRALRIQWRGWGPANRHPNFAQTGNLVHSDKRPAFRQRPSSGWFVTM